LLVNDRVIVECKATVAYNSLFEAQALTYLRLCELRLALVINFGERQVRQGIKRLTEKSSSSYIGRVVSSQWGIGACAGRDASTGAGALTSTFAAGDPCAASCPTVSGTG
jgi:PD-(D/E)XK nuclease superfamily